MARDDDMRTGVGWHVVGVLCSACLAVSLFAAGFAVCTLQPTTRLLSTLTSDAGGSPYTHGQLVRAAVATRDFTVEPFANGEDYAKGMLGSAIMDAAFVSSTDPDKAARWSGMLDAAYANVEGTAEGARSLEDYHAMIALAAADDAYALDLDAVGHLVDCNTLINRVRTPLLCVAGLALLSAAVLFFACRRVLCRALTAAPAVLLAAMVALGAWAALDFTGFFAAFHGVFFPQGNWMFSATSLLITMLPRGFWVGMGAIWLFVTILLCVASLVAARRLKR